MTTPLAQRSPTGRASSRSPWLTILPILLLTGTGAGPRQPVPNFAGSAIPDPPQQRAPWTPPATKLPRFLVTATTALFDAGMADPRGCEYRNIEVGKTVPFKTRGFVLPEQSGQGGRFAISWDGIIYPVVVGPPADLDADARTVADLVGKRRADAMASGNRQYTPIGFVYASAYVSDYLYADRPAKVELPTSLKLVLLLRLGRVDLAERLFAVGTPWTPEKPRLDLTDYRISLVTLADEHAPILLARLVAAHRRSDDVVALDAARRLDAFARSIDAQAKALGFPRRGPQFPDAQVPGYFGPLPQLDLLLADQERRAAEPPRGPIPPRGGDPSARIAALIRNLDQIGARPRPGFDPPSPATDPLVSELVAEGKPAVGPLLDALDSDQRLTRCVTVSEQGGPIYVDPVVQAIVSALYRIVKPGSGFKGGYGLYHRSTPEDRRRMAAAFREFWEKNRDVSPTERIYRTLRDDKAWPSHWLEAASDLIQTADGFDPRNPILPRPLRGEPLRDHREPSVSDLLARRAVQQAGREDGLGDAFTLASILSHWDKPAARPLLKKYLAVGVGRGGIDPRFIELATHGRAIDGDPAALDAFAARLTTSTPSTTTSNSYDNLEPMWTYPDHPALVKASRAMFLDPGSPWSPLPPEKWGTWLVSAEDPIASPLACIGAFREALLTLLADKTLVGTATWQGDQIQYALSSGASGGFSTHRDSAPDERPGVKVPLRICDLVAWKLVELEGTPEVALTRDEAHRDESVASCVAYLRRYGRNLSPRPPPNEEDFPRKRAHLRFPTLDRPATADDVRETRAIFSLEGEGEVRLASLPKGFPILARWPALKDRPMDRPEAGDTIRREYFRAGYVWQAEEVRRGDQWERFYGFAGPGTIARVPASEVEFPQARYSSPNMPGGLDAQFWYVAWPPDGVVPDGPILARLVIRNGSGLDRAVPTEFVRPDADGKPALRRGIDLTIIPEPADGSQTAPDARKVEIPPARTARFDPGPASRTLAPTEAFEAARIDLNEWFSGLRPGSYRLRIDFGEDSGLGRGRTFLPLEIRDPGDGAN